MSVKTFFYKIGRELSNHEITLMRSIVLAERLHAKIAEMRPKNGPRRVEVVVGEVAVMENLATIFARRTGNPLPYEEGVLC